MIDIGMYVALGFLLASLLALMVAPAFWKRAVRLTSRRIEMTMPMSAVDIQADSGAEVLRERAGYDADASRLGELALVDREGRIGTLGTTFYNTLLDENAASHIALGNAYELTVGAEDVPKINKSAIHVDFMIGGDDVEVTGLTADGGEVPVLRGGTWQI